MNKKQEASNNIANRLTWHTASRDQAGIAKELAEDKDIPEVYGLGEAGLFDEFFYFRIVSGLPLCLPGLNQRQKKGPVPIRGPVSCDFIRDTLMSIAASTLEKMFNRGISILAEHKLFPKTIHALLDASQIESTEKCKGCGKVTKDKPPELRLRKKRIRRVLETVFGFKIWVVWDPNSRLPLSMRFTTIEVHDINLAQEVVQQAIDNLGEHEKISSLAKIQELENSVRK